MAGKDKWDVLLVTTVGQQYRLEFSSEKEATALVDDIVDKIRSEDWIKFGEFNLLADSIIAIGKVEHEPV